MSKNDLIEQLINSDIEENRTFGTLLLSSEQIPEEEREPHIMKLINEFLTNNKLSIEMQRNLISAYNNLSLNKSLKNRVVKL
jgi:hypothetical protein